MQIKPAVTTAQQQQKRVNSSRVCVCFRLRNAITLCIGLSLIAIIGSGFSVWIDASLRYKEPWRYYTYVSTAIVLESLTAIFVWIGVYYHIRCMVKYSLYWTLTHTLYIPVLFSLTNLFNIPHYSLAIIWIILQFLSIYLLWKYKQLLKKVYDWDDERCPDNSPSSHQEETPVPHPQQPSFPNVPMAPIQTIQRSANQQHSPQLQDDVDASILLEHLRFVDGTRTSSDSEGLYHNESPAHKTTTGSTGYGGGEAIRPANIEQIIAAAPALPEEDAERMMQEADALDAWIIQTLKQCAPLNDEWSVLWNNFKNNNVTHDTLKHLCHHKQRYHEEWVDLIPKIGHRIQFQQALDKRLEAEGRSKI